MEVAEQIKYLADELRTSYGYTENQLRALILEERSVPATVFSTSLSPLKALVTYLHDSEKIDFVEISQMVRRSYRAVWGAYHKEGVSIDKCDYYIPMSAYNDSLSILESVVVYLKNTYNLKFSEIARLLGKNQRTIWTVWTRAQKKLS